MTEERPQPAAFAMPDPSRLRLVARGALAQGSSAVAFPIGDVLRMADELDNVLVLIGSMKAIIESQSIYGRLVVEQGQKVIELAKAGKVNELAELFAPFESALRALNDELPDPEAEAARPTELAN